MRTSCVKASFAVDVMSLLLLGAKAKAFSLR